jgi:hypothetical protein
MLSLIPLLNIALCAGYAFAVYRTVTAALDAPIGYEDDAGFHYGLDPVHIRR